MKGEILSCRFRSLNFKNQIVDEVENLDLPDLMMRLEQSRYGVKELNFLFYPDFPRGCPFFCLVKKKRVSPI